MNMEAVISEDLLFFTEEVRRDTAVIYDRIKDQIPLVEWQFFAPYIACINKLKKEKNAVILAHNYMSPEIYHGIADFVGDSLQLAIQATKVDADIIIQCGVHFMAETSKIMNPQKTVLLPDMKAGCSLASSITGADVVLLRQKYPGVPVVTYVNTGADVKAESDICCTSSNAADIVRNLPNEQVILIPDQYLAQNVARQTGKKIITWAGSCIVHETFTAEDVARYRTENPDIIILAHPECPPSVCDAADFTGSTSAMSNYVKTKQPHSVLMITECSMADNVSAENPAVKFVKPCQLCPHMKRISLPNVLDVLQNMSNRIEVEESVAERARVAIQKMIDFKS